MAAAITTELYTPLWEAHPSRSASSGSSRSAWSSSRCGTFARTWRGPSWAPCCCWARSPPASTSGFAAAASRSWWGGARGCRLQRPRPAGARAEPLRDLRERAAARTRPAARRPGPARAASRRGDWPHALGLRANGHRPRRRHARAGGRLRLRVSVHLPRRRATPAPRRRGRLSRSRAAASEFDPSKGIVGRVMRLRAPVLLRDVDADPAYIRAAPDVRSEACVPLLAGDRFLGVLNVRSRRGFSRPRTYQALSIIADRLAAAP
ncbi:MAG: GAF domain-containing protein [Chloroflexota bacterium]